MTKAELISDVILQVTQSAPSDDSEISQDQIAFWGTYHLNQLVTQEIFGELKNGRSIPPIYLVEEDCKVMELQEAECGNNCQDRVYIDLTDEVVDLPKDAGIVRVITEEGDQVLKVAVENIDIVKFLRFAKPSVTNLQYSRQAKRIYIQGIGPQEMDLDAITVVYVKKQDISTLNDTDSIIASDQIRPYLIDAVVQRLKLEMYGSEADQSNDGVDYKNAAYHNVIANPANRTEQPQQE